MNEEISNLVAVGEAHVQGLADVMHDIKIANGLPDIPTPPDPPTPPNPDFEFSGGTFKTYNLRGDWGGRDIWMAGFLWKPLGEHTQNLVVLMPGHIPGPDATTENKAERTWVASQDGTFITELKYTGLANPIHALDNLMRTHWRADKPGQAFPSPCVVVSEGSDGNRLIWPIKDSSQRNAGPVNKSGVYAGNNPIQMNSVVLWKKPQAGEDPPVEPPLPPPPGNIELPEVLRRPRLWIWREGSKANDFGAKEAVVVATHGKAGAATVRIIAMNGDPVTSVSAMVERAQRAKREGCAAVCIDLESFFIREGKAHGERVYRAVSSVLPLLWAPKAFNDHIETHYGLKFDDAAKWLEDFGNGQIPWIYSKATAGPWIDLWKKTKSAGNNDLYIPLGDFAPRGDHTPFNHTAPPEFKAAGLSIGVFMPDTNGYSNDIQATSTWRKSVEVYA